MEKYDHKNIMLNHKICRRITIKNSKKSIIVHIWKHSVNSWELWLEKRELINWVQESLIKNTTVQFFMLFNGGKERARENIKKLC